MRSYAPQKPVAPLRVFACVSARVLAGLFAGAVGLGLVVPPASSQTGVWRQIAVPGEALGVAVGDSGSVLFSNRQGAYRYDGMRARREPIFSPGVDSLEGSAILEAANGDVWLGTSTGGLATGGLYRLRPDGTVDRYTRAEGIGNSSNEQILALAETPDGVIWAGTGGGLSRFDGTTWTTITTDQGLPALIVAALDVAPDGSLWVGTTGPTGGLAHVVNGAVVSVHRGFTLTPQNNVRAVCVTRAGEVWLGHDRGLAHLVGSTFDEYDATTSVVSIAEGAHGELWFGTANRGVGRWDTGEIRIVPSGPPSNVIRHLATDAAGVLWVATSGGAARFEGASWLTYSPTDRLVTLMSALVASRDVSVAARGDSIDGDGITWIGTATSVPIGPTQFAKLARRANGRLRLLGTDEGLPSGVLDAIAPTDSGAIWCGTAATSGGGVARVSAAGVVSDVAVSPGTFPASQVFALADAGGGRAWAATGNGAVYVDRAGHRALPTGAVAMPDAPFVAVAVDAQGRAWFATGTPPIGSDPRPAAGAVRFDPADSSYARVGVAQGLPTNDLAGVAVAADGAVWFASTRGVTRWIDGATRTFTLGDGLPSSDAKGVAVAPDGRVWAATAAGLAVFDGVQWSAFSVADGLAGASVRRVFADSIGVLASCGFDGASLFHPDRTAPRVEIVSGPPAVTGASTVQFAVNGGDLDSDDARVLLSTELEGRGATPFVEDVTSVSYNVLDGDYVFRLRGKDRALNETVEPFEWRFTVDATPPRPVIASPAFDAIVADTVDVLGTVDDARFAAYVVELRRQGAVAWDTVLVSASPPVVGAPLFRWASRDVDDGVWELRVGTVDALGLVGYAQVSVIVDNFEPRASVTAPAQVDHATGGSVFSTNGEVEVYFPPNAMAADRIVRIDPVAVRPDLPALGGRAFYTAWEVTAEDIALVRPVTLTIVRPPVVTLASTDADFAPTTVPSIHRLVVDGADTTLVGLGGSLLEGNRVATTVDQFGTFVLASGVPVSGAGFSGPRDLDCQPRVLSPRGGGYATKTSISFELGKSGTGAVKVYDRAGRLVKELSESGTFEAGRNVVDWDGTDGDGDVVPSGLYTVAVRFDGETAVRTVVVANK